MVSKRFVAVEVVLISLFLLFLIESPILAATEFFILITVAIIAPIWAYFRRVKCLNCHRRSTHEMHRVELEPIRGFGLVNRYDTANTQGVVGNSHGYAKGNTFSSSTTTQRQERAPVITRRVQRFYKCKRCSTSFSKIFSKTSEDFSRSGYESVLPLVQEKIIEKVIVKIPCQYCRTLVEIQESKCPNCGAPLRV